MPSMHPTWTDVSPAKRALLDARLKGLRRPHDTARRTSAGEAPPSFAQEGFWLVDRAGQGGAAYQSTVSLRLIGVLDVGALTRAVGEIVRRHDALRTTFAEKDGTLTQVIAPFDSVALPLDDLSGLPVGERQPEAKRRIAACTAQPFDLVSGPLLRVVLLRLDAAEHVFVAGMHHIITDGWSWTIFLRELGTLYGAYREGRESPLSELPWQYGDYAVWQREQATAERARGLQYWTNQLAGAPVLLPLPLDRPRLAAPRNHGAFETLAPPAALLARLQALATEERATLYMVLLAAFKVLLFRYSGCDDVVVGAPVAGRTRHDVQGLIGLFVNTVVMRTTLTGDPSFRDALRRVRETTLGAYEHQDVPFHHLVATLQPKRTSSHTPLFQVFFELRTGDAGGLTWPGLSVQPIDVASGVTKFDLALDLMTGADGLVGGFSYRTDLFDAATIQRMAAQLTRVLLQVTADPDMRLSALQLADADEREQLLAQPGPAACPALCAHELFEIEAARTPAAAAVVCGDESLTYEELDRRANRLAHDLRRRGVGPETRVGICLERCAELVIAVIGILKSGAAYVPLDPTYPSERLEYMLADSSTAVLLTRERQRAHMSVSTRVAVISMDSPPVPIEGDDAAPVSGVTPDNLCYVIYTSGSTGRPKGVAVPHRGLVNYIDWARRTYGASAGHGAPVFTSLAVDLTVTSLLPLFAGGAIRLLRDEQPIEALAEMLRTRPGFGLIKITPLQLSLLTSLITIEEAPGAAHTIVIGGEVLDADVTRFWEEHAPDTTLVNEYGPTETVVGCTASVIPPGAHRHGPLPVGAPIQNVQNYVLDDQGELQPVGMSGELYIGGVGVARGYLGRPRLTAERFVPDPFANERGARMYRSGDRARWHAYGTLLVDGRTDRQVKVRGYRVELGEIEEVLRAHPGVRACVALLREDRPGDRRLVAYVVGDATDEELRADARRRLPDHMVPSAFILLDALPHTSTGKLDRQALPIPDYGPQTSRDDSPQDFVEVQLIHIWEELLGVHGIGPAQDFFELGGNSLLALHLLAQIKRRLQCNLPLSTLVGGTTVRQMAAVIREQRQRTPDPPTTVVPLQPRGTLPPLFCVHPAGRGVSVYVHLVRYLGPHQPVFGVMDLAKKLDRPVRRIAAEHLHAIRAAQPEGPYYLLGWSFGGVVAYEIAVQLQRQHQQVAFVAVVDTMETGIWRELLRQRPAWRVATLASEIAEKMGGAFSLRAEDLEGLTVDEQCRRAVEALHDHQAAPRDFTARNLRQDYYDVVALRERSRRRHRARRLSGQLTLFRRQDTPTDYQQIFAPYGEEAARTLGWAALAPDGVEVQRVPGTHRAMFCEPHVRVFAERLRESLVTARARVESWIGV